MYMKEVFKVGYTTYLEKSKKREKKHGWTSKVLKMVAGHKFVVTILGVAVTSFLMNCWLVFKFVHILEMSKVF